MEQRAENITFPPGSVGRLLRSSNRRKLIEMATAALWRDLKDEFRRIAEHERQVVPDPADARRLIVHGDYTGANRDSHGAWHVSDGVSADVRISFEETATRAGAALHPPSGVDPLPFWLHSLTTFLREQELSYENSRYLAMWDPDRVAIIRDAAAASVLYCSYLAKECTSAEVEGSSSDGNTATALPVQSARGVVSRRATADVEVEDLRQRVKQMRAEGASHQEVCRRLADTPRPARTAWKHLTWDKAFKEPLFRRSVCKWLSKHCRPQAGFRSSRPVDLPCRQNLG